MAISHLAFEVIPTGWSEITPDEGRFNPFVLEVPTLGEPGDAERCARRAYFQAFHYLGAQGIDVDEFTVYEFTNDERGRTVDQTGYAEVSR